MKVSLQYACNPRWVTDRVHLPRPMHDMGLKISLSSWQVFIVHLALFCRVNSVQMLPLSEDYYTPRCVLTYTTHTHTQLHRLIVVRTDHRRTAFYVNGTVPKDPGLVLMYFAVRVYGVVTIYPSQKRRFALKTVHIQSKRDIGRCIVWFSLYAVKYSSNGNQTEYCTISLSSHTSSVFVTVSRDVLSYALSRTEEVTIKRKSISLAARDHSWPVRDETKNC